MNSPDKARGFGWQKPPSTPYELDTGGDSPLSAPDRSLLLQLLTGVKRAFPFRLVVLVLAVVGARVLFP